MSASRAPRRRILIVAGLAAIVLAAIVQWWNAGGPNGADADNPAQVAQGAALYAEHCAACHGARLEGQPRWQERKSDGKLAAPPHDASGHTWHHGDTQLFALTKHGVAPFAPPGYQSEMPAYADRLDDGQIWAILAFIKSTWPAEIRQRQAEISRRAASR